MWLFNVSSRDERDYLYIPVGHLSLDFYLRLKVFIIKKGLFYT